MIEKISIDEHKKKYNTIIKSFNKKEFIDEIIILIFVAGIFIIFSLTTNGFEKLFIVIFIILGLFTFIRHQHYSDYKIKEKIINIEELKTEYKKLIKNKAKKNLTTLLLIYAILTVLIMSWSFFSYGITLGLVIMPMTTILSLLFVWVVFSFLEFITYKGKISEKRFKEIDDKVNETKD